MQRTTTGRKRRLGSVVLRISSKGYENEELRARKRAECGWASPGYQPYRPLGTPDLDRKKPLQADTNSASGLLLAPSTDSSGGSKISSSHVPGAGKKHGEGKGIFGSLQYRVGYVRGNGYKVCHCHKECATLSRVAITIASATPSEAFNSFRHGFTVIYCRLQQIVLSILIDCNVARTQTRKMIIDAISSRVVAQRTTMFSLHVRIRTRRSSKTR